jgi:predicted dehydrogenase
MAAAERPVTIGAVGLGYWGPNLARAWNGTEETELRWVCDLDEDQLGRVGNLYPHVRRTGSLDDLLADPALDAVSIATSVPTHAALARRALEAGKHVYVEKPLAMTAADARMLRGLAESSGLTLQVGHLLVHHPAVLAIESLLGSGELGGIHYVYANRVNLGKVRADENALWSLGPHDVAVLLHLIGEMPVTVSAHGQCFLRSAVEDVVFGLLRFPSGVIAHLHLSWLDPHKMRRLTVVGSDKMAVFDDMSADQKLTVYDKGVTNGGGRGPGYGEALQVRYGDTYIPRISAEEPLRIQSRHFARCVRGEEAPRSAAVHGVAVVEVLEALQRSLDQQGALVPVETDVVLPLRRVRQRRATSERKRASRTAAERRGALSAVLPS